ncbi:hypothetical protein GW17_00033445 [Ensete ventricosum]|nr:hypothetical protein GW17_00033445 [Ensete ventricosum]RZR82681.1 hypothetical protein BHM03_00009165 [Ensete ventricosum]
MCCSLLRAKQPIRGLLLDQILPWVLSHGGIFSPPALPLSAFTANTSALLRGGAGKMIVCVAVVGHQVWAGS